MSGDINERRIEYNHDYNVGYIIIFVCEPVLSHSLVEHICMCSIEHVAVTLLPATSHKVNSVHTHQLVRRHLATGNVLRKVL